jgi:hypothetical protein
MTKLRVRFTIGRLMIMVVIIAFTIALARMVQLISLDSRQKAEDSRRIEDPYFLQ